MSELLPISELQNASPLFRGRCGSAFARSVLRAFEVTAVQHLYDDAVRDNAPDSAAALLQGLNLNYTVEGLSRLDNLPPGPFITVSNHPIGSLDGVIMLDLMGHRFPDYKMLANSFLMRIEALRPGFIAVEPTLEKRTAPKTESINGIRTALQHLRDGHPLGIFPSGAVSDLVFGRRPVVTLPQGQYYVPAGNFIRKDEAFSYKEPRVRDREWQIPVVKFISKAGVPVVPIRFFDGNSAMFYWLGAVLGWKVRLSRLPHEVMNKRDKTIRMCIGPVITPELQRSCSSVEQLRTLLRAAVYGQKL